MSRRVLTLIATLTLVFTVAGPATAQTAAPDEVAERSVAAPASPKLHLEPAQASVSIENPLKGATEGIFVIRLDAEPLATYRGGVVGLAPTSPLETGTSRLDAASAESRAYVDYLQASQTTFLARMEKTLGHEADVRFTYTNSTNGMAVWLTPREAARVARIPGVRSVRQEVIEQIQTDAGPALIGAPSIWGGTSCVTEGGCGEGVVVGVLDTGINPDNPSFADPGPKDLYDYPTPGSGYLGECATGGNSFGCTDKLIGAYSFTATGSALDDDGHGSHTASTAAGNFVEASIISPTLTVTRDISGVAPHAQIISYRVCEAGGCPSSSTIAAIDQAIIDGVDVINFSVGSGSPEDPWNSDSQAAWLAARQAGIFVAHSAGNEGPGDATVGSPMAPWMLHTAATTHNRVYTNSLAGMTGGATAPPADIAGAGFTDALGPAPIVFAGDHPSNETDHPELCGAGTIGDFDSPWGPDEFDGEIVVCIRGDFGRVEKGANVLAAGAGGFVLIDDGSGLVGDPHELPGVHITAEDGADLLNWLAGGTGHVAAIGGATLDESAANADVLAGFSSRGPNRSVPAIIAPSVAAPGVDVIAADGINGAVSWGFNSGTSMASPHAAGAGALLVGLHPDWTPAEVQSALMTTGTTNVVREDGVTPATPFDQGSGRIQVDVATDAGLLLDIPNSDFAAVDPGSGGDPSTLNLPSMANDQCVLECSWTRTVEATTAGTWTAAATADGFGVSVEPTSFTLAAGATQEVTVTADVTAGDTGVWMFGDLTLSAAGVPDTYMPIAVQASTGNLPESIDIATRRDAGSHVVSSLTAVEITELTVGFTGLAIGDQMDLLLAEDSANGSAFDDLEDGVAWTTVEVPAGATRLVAETFDSESPDLDLFVGTGTTPNEGNTVCVSDSGTADEFCDLAAPEAGTYWILVQNWSGSGAGSDAAMLSYGVVTGDEGNLLAEGPGAQPQLEPFDLGILFNEPNLMAGDRAYGTVSIGSDPGSPGNVGTIPINLTRLDNDVIKSVSPATAEPGDTLTYTITVQPNRTEADIAYDIVDFIPEGLTYVPGSATGGLRVRSDGALTWNGTMERVLDTFYAVTTSSDDPLCAMPLADADDAPDDAYVNLAHFGYAPNPGLTGDSTVWSVDAGDYDLYDNTYSKLEFTDDGFAIFDSATHYAGSPWLNQALPDPTPPNNVAAMFWQDFEIVYDAATNAGITTVNLLDGADMPIASIIEYDDVRPWTQAGDGAVVMDFQIYVPLAVDETGPEIIYAYDNILLDATGTIGVENASGTSAETLLNNDFLSSVGLADGDAVCFDLTASVADPVVLTYDVTVDAGTEGTVITNDVEHTASTHGSETETSSVDVAIGDVTPPTDGAIVWATDVLSSSLTLMWDPASDDRAVTGYSISRDGVHLADIGTVTMYDVTDLSPDTKYEFIVKAMDAQGNASDGLMLTVATAVDFIDDNFSIFEDDIEWLYGAGITRGCNPPLNNMFCPSDNLTRGQLAAMINRAFDLPATTEDFFTDDEDSVFEDDINRIAAAGITIGCNPPANDNFCPDDSVTRGQMAALLDRGLDLPAATTDFFADDDGHIFEDSINNLGAAGITAGCNPPANDNYCPDNLLTRGQTAAFFRRALS